MACISLKRFVHKEKSYTFVLRKVCSMPQQVTPISSYEFGKIFSEYHARFISLASRYVRDEDVARDLVSDSFMSFWENRSRMDGDVNVPAYILTMVKNRCLNHLDSQIRHMNAEKNIMELRTRLIQADIRSLEGCDPKSLFAKEVRDMIGNSLESMPEMTRNVFLCSRVEGKKYSEIAETLGITVSRVNFEMKRALGILRRDLKDYLPHIILFLFLHGFIR